MGSSKLRNISYTIALSILLPLLTHYTARLIVGYFDLSPVVEGQVYFCVSAFIGILSILFGYFTSVDYLAAGAIIGGTFCLLLGYSYYWYDISDALKVLSILVAIAIIMATGYRFSRKPD